MLLCSFFPCAVNDYVRTVTSGVMNRNGRTLTERPKLEKTPGDRWKSTKQIVCPKVKNDITLKLWSLTGRHGRINQN